jgi:hypothetical protein
MLHDVGIAGDIVPARLSEHRCGAEDRRLDVPLRLKPIWATRLKAPET